MEAVLPYMLHATDFALVDTRAGESIFLIGEVFYVYLKHQFRVGTLFYRQPEHFPLEFYLHELTSCFGTF